MSRSSIRRRDFLKTVPAAVAGLAGFPTIVRAATKLMPLTPAEDALLARAFEVEPAIEYLPARKEVIHAFSSHELIRRVFNPPTPVPLEVGIRRMAQWVRNRGPMSPVEFENIEVTVNLPLAWTRPPA